MHAVQSYPVVPRGNLLHTWNGHETVTQSGTFPKLAHKQQTHCFTRHVVMFVYVYNLSHLNLLYLVSKKFD